MKMIMKREWECHNLHQNITSDCQVLRHSACSFPAAARDPSSQLQMVIPVTDCDPSCKFVFLAI